MATRLADQPVELSTTVCLTFSRQPAPRLSCGRQWLAGVAGHQALTVPAQARPGYVSGCRAHLTSAEHIPTMVGRSLNTVATVAEAPLQSPSAPPLCAQSRSTRDRRFPEATACPSGLSPQTPLDPLMSGAVPQAANGRAESTEKSCAASSTRGLPQLLVARPKEPEWLTLSRGLQRRRRTYLLVLLRESAEWQPDGNFCQTGNSQT